MYQTPDFVVLLKARAGSVLLENLCDRIPPMSKLTPEERTSTERRLAEVAARMAELQPTLSSTIAPEWVDLYRERAQLEHRLKDDA